MPGQEIYRCSDGHLYSAEPVRALLLSAHLGVGRHFQRCPVDRHWRTARRVRPGDLDDRELAEARRHTF